MKHLRNIFGYAVALTLILTGAGCGGARNQAVTVISREDGSGTRSAFVELFGVQDENKVDNTIASSEVTNNTGVMITSVAGNPSAIGYISLGSLNDTVKALRIDGVDATTDNVSNKTYKISRPFYIATKGGKEAIGAAAQDFINFILSKDGQDIIEANGYIRIPDTGAFAGSNASEKVVVAGSSSVTPVMEKLKEAYLSVNPGGNIEIQQSDSSTGLNNAIEGVCDIGMASRDLKDSEIEKGLTPTLIAMDGLAVIVNKNNPVNEMTKDQVKDIYTGGIVNWTDVK